MNQINAYHDNTDDDAISLAELLAKLADFWRRRRVIAVALMVAGVMLGGLAAAFLNPWVVQVNVRNIDGFFDLNTLKSVQFSLHTYGLLLSDAAGDPTLAKKVEAKLEANNWIEQNITPEYSISKADLRSSSLPDQAQAVLAQNSQLLFLRVQVTDSDVAEAEKQASLIANLGARLAMREQLLSYLVSQLDLFRKEVTNDNPQLSAARITFAATDRHLALAQDVARKLGSDGMPTSTSQVLMQSQLSAGSGDAVFLPIDRQVSGMEIASGLRQADLDQWLPRFTHEVQLPLTC